MALENHTLGIPWWNDVVRVPAVVIERGFVRVPEGLAWGSR